MARTFGWPLIESHSKIYRAMKFNKAWTKVLTRAVALSIFILILSQLSALLPFGGDRRRILQRFDDPADIGFDYSSLPPEMRGEYVAVVPSPVVSLEESAGVESEKHHLHPVDIAEETRQEMLKQRGVVRNRIIHKRPPSPPPVEQAAAIVEHTSFRDPITICVASSHFLGRYEFDTDTNDMCNQYLDNKHCSIRELGSDNCDQADALWFHIPTTPKGFVDMTLRKSSGDLKQLTVGFSMESSEYYKNMDDPEYMLAFDILMTYRLDSHVVTSYFSDIPAHHMPPRVPTAQKLSSVAYINRNCGALNQRNQFVKDLMDLYPVAAYSSCLHNTDSPDGQVKKVEVMSRHKFCIAIENSNTRDYVTEKLWDALDAACLPIYGGAPNIIQDFLPHPKSVIVVDTFKSSIVELAELLAKLDADNRLYDEYMEWRTLPLEKLSLGYQERVRTLNGPRTECQLCRQVGERRGRGSPFV